MCLAASSLTKWIRPPQSMENTNKVFVKGTLMFKLVKGGANK